MTRAALALALAAAAFVTPAMAADPVGAYGGAVAVAPPSVVVVAGGSVQALRAVFVRAAPTGTSAFLQPVAGGETVQVLGCLPDYSWCHVSTRGIPGWLAAADLAYVAGERSVPIVVAGPQIGILVVSD